MLPLVRKGEPGPTPGADILRDRVILVSGATGGFGRSCALACARVGATLILLGRRVRALESLYDEIEALGAPIPAIYPMDLEGATPQDYADLAGAVQRDCRRLDGIVHAAAHFKELQPFDQQPPEEWERSQRVNVTAPLLLTQACMPLLRDVPDAAIVFVLDDLERVGRSFWGAYGVAKHALVGLVSIIHEETESSPVRTHALLPAPMRTTIRRKAYFGEDTLRHPLPDIAGAAAAWLLGPQAAELRGKILALGPEAGTAGSTIWPD
ncbi:MAG: SDR family NAD(P)-dependent oxidoreductase [Rhodanobacteraceae bacterium]